MARLEIHKFGGTSVGDPARMVADAHILAEAAADGRSLVAVASAMGGVTDALIGAAAAAVARDRPGARAALDSLAARHRAALADLAGDTPAPEAAADIQRIIDELDDLLAAVVLLGEMTARTRDRLLASGEKLSVRLLALALHGLGQAG